MLILVKLIIIMDSIYYMNILKTNLNLLKFLQLLLAEESVSNAAKLGFITQPAMSNALIRLRELFQDPLLIRNGRSMKKTAFAQALLPKVNAILHEIEHLTDSRFDPLKSDLTFTLGVYDYLEPLLLPTLIKLIEAKAPKIRLHIRKLDVVFDPKAPENEKMDAGITILNSRSRYFQHVKLFTDSAICIMSKDNPLSSQALTLENYLQVSHLAIITTDEPVDSIVDKTLADLGHSRKIALATPNIYSALSIIAQTNLLAIIPKSIALKYSLHYPLQLVDLPFHIPTIDIELIWHRSLEKSLAQIWFRNTIIEAIEDTGLDHE